MIKDHKETVLRRLKSIEGHVRGIEAMVESDTYCIDVLKQTHAVQKALDKVNALIMQNHMKRWLGGSRTGFFARLTETKPWEGI